MQTLMGDDQNNNWRSSIASTLEWWRDAGVDCEIDDVPRDWSVRAVAAPVAEALPGAAGASPIEPTILPATLDEFTAWRLSAAAPEAAWPGKALGTQGSASSALMVVVDTPDREDDAGGKLLSGAVGRLFDRMLAAIGRDRQSVYIAALALKRPPAGRVTPEASEKLCDLLRHHMSLAKPKRVLALGNAASRAITGMDVANARGNLCVVNHDGGTSEVVASFHPRFLLERPVVKADAWKDLKMLTGGLE